MSLARASRDLCLRHNGRTQGREASLAVSVRRLAVRLPTVGYVSCDSSTTSFFARIILPGCRHSMP